MAALPRFKICVELHPQGSAPLPPPRQYAGRWAQAGKVYWTKVMK